MGARRVDHFPFAVHLLEDVHPGAVSFNCIANYVDHAPFKFNYVRRGISGEDGESYSVVFVGGTGINRGVKLLDNKRHPSIVEDYARTFRVLKDLPADVFLAHHPCMYGMAEKLGRLKAGATVNPFVDPEGYQRFLVEEEGKYLKQLEEERAARQ